MSLRLHYTIKYNRIELQLIVIHSNISTQYKYVYSRAHTCCRLVGTIFRPSEHTQKAKWNVIRSICWTNMCNGYYYSSHEHIQLFNLGKERKMGKSCCCRTHIPSYENVFRPINKFAIKKVKSMRKDVFKGNIHAVIRSIKLICQASTA